MKIPDIFRVTVAKSRSLKKYKTGDTAFVSNGFFNNGVLGFVTPKRGDRVFDSPGICVSAFCEATVHNPPFMGRGNGGSGIIVIEPIEELSQTDLFFYASFINNKVRWRFSFGRMVSKDRILQINIPQVPVDLPEITVPGFLPPADVVCEKKYDLVFRKIKLTSLFELHSGDFHNAGRLPEGEMPLVSCGEKNNGIIKFVDVPEDKTYENKLTIAFNGQPLTTKYHPYKFAAKDDVAVCLPLLDLETTTLLYIQLLISTEKWRFSYGRKCFKDKLSRLRVNLPITEKGLINERIIGEIVSNTTYYNFLKSAFRKEIQLNADIV